jgi:cyclase
MAVGSAGDIAAVFAGSDRTELPDLIGVRSRSLFQFEDLYLHLIEGERPIGPAVAQHRHHPAFRQVSQELTPFVTAYRPETWREPADAMAKEFYHWRRSADG